MSKNNEIIKLGTIVLSDRIVVSDPCYSRDVACMKDNVYIKQGKYGTYAIKSNQEKSGNRIACIICILEQNIDCLKNPQKNKWGTLDDNIGVTSGQVGIFDNIIYPVLYRDIYFDDNNEFNNLIDYNTFYDACCEITLNEQQCGILKNKKGIVSTSGYGNGFYKLKILKEDKDDICIAIMVDFDVISHQSIIDALEQI